MDIKDWKKITYQIKDGIGEDGYNAIKDSLWDGSPLVTSWVDSVNPKEYIFRIFNNNSINLGEDVAKLARSLGESFVKDLCSSIAKDIISDAYNRDLFIGNNDFNLRVSNSYINNPNFAVITTEDNWNPYLLDIYGGIDISSKEQTYIYSYFSGVYKPIKSIPPGIYRIYQGCSFLVLCEIE